MRENRSSISCLPSGSGGFALLFSPQHPARWSYFLTEPMAEIRARKNVVETLNGVNGKIKKIKSGKPLDVFEKFFKEYAQDKTFDPMGPPFQGGAVGFLSYEALHYLEEVPMPKTDDVNVPWIDFQFFDSGVAYDHWEKKFHVFGPDKKTNALLASFQAALKQLRRPSAPSGKTGKIASNFSKPAYFSAVRKIKDCIAAGETFQANLSQRFSTKTTKNPRDVFVRLNQVNPSPYSAFFQSGDLCIASASPELLFSVASGLIVTRPIKGTRPRGRTPAEDKKFEAEMVQDAKERAENAMIVDLERNDLGKVCQTGSVKVSEAFSVEKYSHVQHLVSQVQGQLKNDATVFDALRALFPGGSITGCPKVRTIQILREIEPVARGPYTGSLGWIGWNGDAAFNILIRTIYFKKDRTEPAAYSAFFHSGGGIVWDSVPQKEYEESLQKAEALRLALQ